MSATARRSWSLGPLPAWARSDSVIGSAGVSVHDEVWPSCSRGPTRSKLPPEVSDSLRARGALGGRVKVEPIFGESLRELAEDGCRLLLKLDIGCFALRFSERDQQPRTQVEQADDEIGSPRPTRVDFEVGDVVDGLLLVLQPQGQALDGDFGGGGCGVGLVHGQKLAR